MNTHLLVPALAITHPLTRFSMRELGHMLKNISRLFLTIALAITISIPVSSYAEGLNAADVITILHQVGASDTLIASVSVALGVTPTFATPPSKVLGAAATCGNAWVA